MSANTPDEQQLAHMRAEAQQDVRDLREKIRALDEAGIELTLSRARSH
ncbi:hypothetical protein [Ahrensia sp. R2A130]|nr:conserved hypothetical protein [Ahrensia sp. R2A130]